MKIQISAQRKIYAVQHEFSMMFPWLILVFFTRQDQTKCRYPRNRLLSSPRTFGEYRNTNQMGSITITPMMTVTELEQSIRDEYDLTVQVFRKSGKSWVETSTNSSWTLKKQNEQGEILSLVIHKTPLADAD